MNTGATPSILLVAWLCLHPVVANAVEAPVTTVDTIHFLIPGAAGGGWDRTARGTGRALYESGLITRVRYENMSGGGGGKAIAHLIERNSSDMLMVNSTPIVIRSLKNIFPQSFRDLTPVASVIGDYSVIAVRQQSAITSIQQLVHKQNLSPRAVAFAGGSVTGGMDHLVSALVLRAAGATPRSVKYIPYDSGGKAMAGLLSGEAQVLTSGFSEVIDLVRQRLVRILCVTADVRLAAAPATPTCHEAGAGNAVFLNWRGFFASPHLTGEGASRFERTLAAMYATPEWNSIRDHNGWVDSFAAGPNFFVMLEQQEAALGELMVDLGLL